MKLNRNLLRKKEETESKLQTSEASTAAGEKEWYFFCLRGRKYRNSIRPNRVTGSGFWKATGIDRPIYSATNSGESIGLKKSLVYYRGSAGKGTKTEWMMHEFRLPPRSESPHTSPSEQEAVWIDMHDFSLSLSLSLPLSSCAYLSFSTEVYIIGKLKISEVGDKQKY